MSDRMVPELLYHVISLTSKTNALVFRLKSVLLISASSIAIQQIGSVPHNVYRNKDEFLNKKVVIVGTGNSAFDIAADLSNASSQVKLIYNSEHIDHSSQHRNLYAQQRRQALTSFAVILLYEAHLS